MIQRVLMSNRTMAQSRFVRLMLLSSDQPTQKQQLLWMLLDMRLTKQGEKIGKQNMQ